MGNGNLDTLVYRLSGILMKFNHGEKLDSSYPHHQPGRLAE